MATENAWSTTRRCVICCHIISEEYFPHVPPTVRCQHPSDACSACLTKALKPNIWREVIKCPVCQISMKEDELKELIDRKSYNIYASLLEQRQLAQMKDWIWCWSCECGQFHEQSSGTPIVTCRSCKSRTCATHKMPWHEGLTCEGFEFLRQIWRAYPHVGGSIFTSMWREDTLRLIDPTFQPNMVIKKSTSYSIPTENQFIDFGFYQPGEDRDFNAPVWDRIKDIDEYRKTARYCSQPRCRVPIFSEWSCKWVCPRCDKDFDEDFTKVVTTQTPIERPGFFRVPSNQLLGPGERRLLGYIVGGFYWFKSYEILDS